MPPTNDAAIPLRRWRTPAPVAGLRGVHKECQHFFLEFLTPPSQCHQLSALQKNLPQKYASIWPMFPPPPPPFLEFLFKNNTKNAIEVITQLLLSSMKSTNISSLQSSYYNKYISYKNNIEVALIQSSHNLNSCNTALKGVQ